MILTHVLLCSVFSSSVAQLPGTDQDYEFMRPPDPPSDEPQDLGTPLEPLCEADAEIPDDLIQCGSCNDRCGNKTNPDGLYSTELGALCACDKFCGFHGDCCQDFQQFCPDEFQDFQETSARYPLPRRYEDFECRSFPGTSQSSMVIHTCPDGSECEFTAELNQDVNSFVPMYDIHRGVHYISGYCAMCNGARQVIPWGVTVECISNHPIRGQEEQEEFIQSGVVNSSNSLNKVTERRCELQYIITGESRPCPTRVISSCKDGCLNQHLVSRCETGPVSYTSLFETYKNVYCALCNPEEGSFTSDLYCGFGKYIVGLQGYPVDIAETISLTLVFDFDPRRGLTVGEHSDQECPIGELYVPDENACRTKTCRSGFFLDGSDCIPETSNITAIVTGTFNSEPTKQMMKSLDQDKTNLETNVKVDVTDIFNSFGITHDELNIQTQMEFNKDGLVVSNFIGCSCNYEALFRIGENNTMVKRFEDSIAMNVKNHVIKYLLNNNVNLETVKAYVKSNLNWVWSLEKEKLDCTWLVYQKNETLSGNGTMIIVATNKIYASGMFEVLDEAVIVCEVVPEMEAKTVDFVLSILTLVCLSVSILCLCMRILLQFCISSFHRKPGRIQLQMTIALLFAFIMLIVGPFFSAIPDACTTAAILMAYGFLAAFTWMNVIAVDTWLVFRPSSAFSRSDEEQRSLIMHYVLGWGIPFLLVAVSVIMNFLDVDEKFRPEFGGSRCWYTQRYAMLIYFGVPIGISIILNIALYIHTAINLHKAFKNAVMAMKAESYHFAVYVKLFILMGITWSFGFISAFTDQIVVDFIFVILTSLQGLFLFISFVCNKRVLKEVKKTVKTETSMTLSERRTKSSRLPNTDSQSKSDSRV